MLRERCAPLLAGLSEAIGHARGEPATLSGTLRIACSVEHATQRVASETSYRSRGSARS